MVDRKVVPFDEFYYQLKLMYLFLLHVVCLDMILELRFSTVSSYFLSKTILNTSVFLYF
jgi:hypothetical protein